MVSFKFLFLSVDSFIFFLLGVVLLLFSFLCLLFSHFGAFKNEVLFTLTETHQCESAHVDVRWGVKFNATHEITLGIEYQKSAAVLSHYSVRRYKREEIVVILLR